jgi:hypothetical protein
MSKKNYNFAAQMGDDLDDMELVKEYGLDPKVAYTPAINEAMFKAMNQGTIDNLTQAGYTEKQAKEIANETTMKAKKATAHLK